MQSLQNLNRGDHKLRICLISGHIRLQLPPVGTEQAIDNQIGGIVFGEPAAHQRLGLFGIDAADGSFMRYVSLWMVELDNRDGIGSGGALNDFFAIHMSLSEGG